MSTPTEAGSLPADIDTLGAWSDRWQLLFNEGKCNVLNLGSDNSRLQYTMCGVSLADMDNET